MVDDDPQIVRLIVSNLTKGDYPWVVYRAGNGQEANEVARKEMPDIILMDWEMPVMNGIEATRTLRKHDKTSHIPVIMATGEMVSSENLRMALEAGAWDYIRKPIDVVEMKARITSAMRLREQQKEVERLMQSEIDLKNRQLSTTSILIVEKNTLIQGLYEEMTEFSDKGGNGNSLLEKVSEIRKRMFNHLEADESWMTFKIHFEEVHPHFFRKLAESSTDISQKDLKLCAYLKLGMDTKEIARLLNVTPASIRTAMYRVKKRLKIDTESNLRDYLSQLN